VHSPVQRLLETSAALFYREGIHAVGVDRILTEAGTTRATLYRHFAGKEDLVVAYLRSEDERLRALFASVADVGLAPEELVRAVIAGIADDVTRHHTRGCPFINAAAEFPDESSPVRSVVADHRAWFRSTLEEVVAGLAGVSSPGEVAGSLVLLRDAALVGAYLDGSEVVRPAFVRTAEQVVGLAPSG
jgi:AcrR family transcriptional regulator